MNWIDFIMNWIDIEESLPSINGVYDVMLCDNETMEFSFECGMFSDGKFVEGRNKEVVMWMPRK